MQKLQDLIQEIRQEIGADFIATDVVYLKDGMSIAGDSSRPNVNVDENVARMTMVMKLASRVTDKIQLGEIEDLLSSVKSGTYVLIKSLGDGSYFWILSVTENATVGMVRIIMNDYKDKIWDAIPKE